MVCQSQAGMIGVPPMRAEAVDGAIPVVPAGGPPPEAPWLHCRRILAVVEHSRDHY